MNFFQGTNHLSALHAAVLLQLRFRASGPDETNMESTACKSSSVSLEPFTWIFCRENCTLASSSLSSNGLATSPHIQLVLNKAPPFPPIPAFHATYPCILLPQHRELHLHACARRWTSNNTRQHLYNASLDFIIDISLFNNYQFKHYFKSVTKESLRTHVQLYQFPSQLKCPEHRGSGRPARYVRLCSTYIPPSAIPTYSPLLGKWISM